MNLFGKDNRPRIDTIDCEHIIDRYTDIISSLDFTYIKKDIRNKLKDFISISMFYYTEDDSLYETFDYNYLYHNKRSYINDILIEFTDDVIKFFYKLVKLWIKTDDIKATYNIGDIINGRTITSIQNDYGYYVLDSTVIKPFEDVNSL